MALQNCHVQGKILNGISSGFQYVLNGYRIIAWTLRKSRLASGGLEVRHPPAILKSMVLSVRSILTLACLYSCAIYSSFHKRWWSDSSMPNLVRGYFGGHEIRGTKSGEAKHRFNNHTHVHWSVMVIKTHILQMW